jgi:hypothetical protein
MALVLLRTVVAEPAGDAAELVRVLGLDPAAILADLPG